MNWGEEGEGDRPVIPASPRAGLMGDGGGRIRSGGRLHFAVMFFGLGGGNGGVLRNVAVGISGAVGRGGLRLHVLAVIFAVDLRFRGSGLRGRLFAIGVTALPAFGLFHPPFIHNVILPMLDAIGAT